MYVFVGICACRHVWECMNVCLFCQYDINCTNNVFVSHYVLPLSIMCLYFVVLCVYFLYTLMCVFHYMFFVLLFFVVVVVVVALFVSISDISAKMLSTYTQ